MDLPNGGFHFFGEQHSGIYTSTRSGKEIEVTLEALMKIMEDLPEPPTILRVDIIASSLLPANTIMISGDIADKLNWEIKSAITQEERTDE